MMELELTPSAGASDPLSPKEQPNGNAAERCREHIFIPQYPRQDTQ